MMKKLAALILSLLITALSPGWGAYRAFAAVLAVPGSLPPNLAVQALARDGLLTGAQDPALPYIYDAETGVVTPLGDLLAKYVSLSKSQAAMDKAYVRESRKRIERMLGELRASKAGGKLLRSRRDKISELAGQLNDAGLSQDQIYNVGSEIAALMSGAQGVQGDPMADLTVIRDGDVVRAFNTKTGRLYRKEDAQGGVLFSREILDKQRGFNELVESGQVRAPLVPDTGSLNIATLKFPAYQLKDQIGKLEENLRYSRLFSMIEIAGMTQQFRPDQLTKPNLREAVEKKVLSTRLPGGWHADQLLDPSFELRARYLGKAQAALDKFENAVDSLASKSGITQEDYQQTDSLYREAARWVTLASAEGQRYAFQHQLEAMDKPDFDKNIRESRYPEAQKKAYLAQKGFLRRRTKVLTALFARLAALLTRDDYSDHMDAIQKLDAESQSLSRSLSEHFGAYTSAAALGKLAHDTNSDNDGAFSVRKAYDWWSEALAPDSGHSRNVRAMRRGELMLAQAFNDVSNGNFALAEARMTALASPEEMRSYLSVSGQGGSAAPSRLERMQAAAMAFQAQAQGVQDVHFWVDLGANVVFTTLTFAVAAPAGAALLTGVARTAKAVAEVVQAVPYVGRAAAFAPRAIQLTAEGFANGLQSLNSSRYAPKLLTHPALIRGYNMLTRELLASVVMTPLSGGMQAARYAMNPAASSFRSAGEAFGAGAKAGLAFPTKWQNIPWMVAGVPAGLFGRATSFGRTFSNFGKGGLVGAGMETVVGKDLIGTGLGALGKKGAAGFAGSFFLGTADQVAKYYVGAELMGLAAGEGTYWTQTLKDRWDGVTDDGGDPYHQRTLEKINASVKAHDFALNNGWRLLPVYTLSGGGAMEMAQLQEHGVKEYAAAGKEVEIANAAAGTTELPLKTLPDVPVYERIFHRDMGTTSPEKAKFVVSEEMMFNHIAKVLEKNVGDNPARLFEITRLKPQAGETVVLEGGLRFRDEVRDTAQRLLEKNLRRDPELVRDILSSPEDGSLPGFGKIGSPLREEVARMVLTNFGRTGLASRAASVVGGRTAARNLRLANRILEANVATETRGLEAGQALRQATKALKSPSEALASGVAELNEALGRWRSAKEKNPGVIGYTELLRVWKDKMLAEEFGLKPEERRAVEAVCDYVVALQERFNTVKVRAANGTVSVERVAPEDWEDFQANLETRYGPGARAEAMVMNAKGGAIRELRPEQAEVLVNFLTSYVLGGRQSTAVLKRFLKLSTGGGKTLLAFEALLPLAEAEARASKTILAFTTPQSNLMAQARADYKAFKKVLSRVEIMTDEEYRTRIAQGKYLGGHYKGRNFSMKGSKPEDYFLITDEMDALGLKPQLTTGEQTATVTTDHPAFRKLNRVLDQALDLAEESGPTAPTRSKAKKTAERLAYEQRRAVDVAPLKSGQTGASRGAAKALFRKIADLALEPATPERSVRLKELAKGYRDLLQESFDSVNPVYEAFRGMDRAISRWVNSPLRKEAPERAWAYERVEAAGPQAAEALLGRGPSEEAVREIEGQRETVQDALDNPVRALIKDPVQARTLLLILTRLHELASGQGPLSKADRAEVKSLSRRYQDVVSASLNRADFEVVTERALSSMARKYARELIGAFWRDPMLDTVSKTTWVHKLLFSLATGRGWVREELLNMARGQIEGINNVRMDNLTHKVVPIHNGEFVPSMDKPDLREKQLKWGADLTLPYEHRSRVTLKDTTSNPKARFIGMSGTAPQFFLEELAHNDTPVLGKGTLPNAVESVIFENATQKYNAVIDGIDLETFEAQKAREILARGRSPSEFERALRKIGQTATPGVEEALQGVNLSGFYREATGGRPYDPARCARLLKAAAEPTELTVVGFSNTRDLRALRNYFQRKYGKQAVAQIFSDGEHLRINRPQARIESQMNLGALGDPAQPVKVLLVDIRVGGRGLDLPFDKGRFGKIKEVIIDPENIAQVHGVQFEGRIAINRVIRGAVREFKYFIDLQTARTNPTLKAMARRMGKAGVDAEVVSTYLEEAQLEAEREQGRSSGVLNDRPMHGESLNLGRP